MKSELLSRYPNDYDLGVVVKKFNLDTDLVKEYTNYRELGNQFRIKQIRFIKLITIQHK